MSNPIGAAANISAYHQNAAMAAGLRPISALGDRTPEQVERDELAQRRDSDPETLDRIRCLARRLITERPTDARPVVVPVDIVVRFGRTRAAYATAFQAWPIGRYEWMYRDSIQRAEFVVTTEGMFLRYDAREPNVELTDQMRWRVPWEARPSEHQWRHKALTALENEFPSEPTFAPTDRPIQRTAADLWTLPQPRSALSPRNVRKLGRLRQAIGVQNTWIDDHSTLFGTRATPQIRGPITRELRKTWKQQDKRNRKMDRLQRRVDEILNA